MENVLLGNVVDLAVSDPNMCVFRAMICRSCSAGTVCLFTLPFTGVSTDELPHALHYPQSIYFISSGKV